MAEASVLSQQAHLSSAIANDMRSKKELIDVVLVCEGHSFQAHRIILSAGSPYFRSMFLSGMEGSTIELSGMDPKAVAIILDVIYCKPFQTPASDIELQALIAAANTLQVSPLYEHCCQEFLTKLSPDYFVDIWNTAEQFQHHRMLQQIPEILGKDFSSVQKCSDFLKLSAKQVKQLLSQARARRIDADCLVQGLLTWVKRDEEERQQHLAPLFANIELSSLSPPFLSQLFMTEELIKKSLELMSSLMAVATSRMMLGQLSQPPQPQIPTQRNDIKLLFISGIGDKTAMQYFDLEASEWSIVMNMPFRLNGLSSASVVATYLKNKLYLIDESIDDPAGKVFAYKPFTSRIVMLDTVIPQPSRHSWATSLNGKIYYVGGESPDGKIQRYVQCFDPIAEDWEFMAPTNHGFGHPNVVPLGDDLYAVDSRNLIVEKYNSGANRWFPISKPEVSMGSETVNYWQAPTAACCNLLYTYDRRRQLWSYDPARLTWKLCQCDIERVIKGMWGVSTKQLQIPYLLILDDEGVLYRYDPKKESSHCYAGSMEFMGKGWLDVLLA